VRLRVVAVYVVLLVAGPAMACPVGQSCVVRQTHVKLQLDAQTAALQRPRDERDQIDMPWIWQVLREHVYARLPRYERPKRITLVLSPVVVKSLSDTVPGVGVGGDF
jgi:hypothetical protein